MYHSVHDIHESRELERTTIENIVFEKKQLYNRGLEKREPETIEAEKTQLENRDLEKKMHSQGLRPYRLRTDSWRTESLRQRT